MNPEKYISTATLVLLSITILSGCVYVPQEGGHSIRFDGKITTEDDVFIMNGEIEVSRGAEPDQVFENVTITLYDKNKNVIKQVDIGKIATNASSGNAQKDLTIKTVNITSTIIPKYVVLESPDFWNRNVDVSVVAYKRVTEGSQTYYRLYTRGNDEKFS